MKEPKKDFIAVYQIVCPYCNFKQTGIVREYNFSTGSLLADSKIPPSSSGPGIKCCMSKLNGEYHCGRLITGDQLEKVTRTAVKSPSDFKS